MTNCLDNMALNSVVGCSARCTESTGFHRWETPTSDREFWHRDGPQPASAKAPIIAALDPGPRVARFIDMKLHIATVCSVSIAFIATITAAQLHSNPKVSAAAEAEPEAQ